MPGVLPKSTGSARSWLLGDFLDAASSAASNQVSLGRRRCCATGPFVAASESDLSSNPAEHQSARRACRDAAGLRGAYPKVSIEAVRTADLRGEAVLRSEIASVGPSGLHPDSQPQQVRKQPLPMLRAVLGQAGEFAMRQLKGSLPKLRGLAGRFVATIRGGHEA